jgi:hypothetical protein
VNLPDNLHCTSNTEFAARPGYDDHEQKEEFTHV